MSLIIDNVLYDVPLSEAILTTEVLDKYAERNANGTLVHALIGVYYIYEFTIGPIEDMTLHTALFNALTAAKPSWVITHPGGSSVVTNTYYVRVDKVTLRRHSENGNRYSEFKVKFIPISKSR